MLSSVDGFHDVAITLKKLAGGSMSPHFDDALYLKLYPEVAEAIRRRQFRSALEHYRKCGYREGRVASIGSMTERFIALAEQDRQFAALKETLQVRDKEIAELRLAINELHRSTCWTLTKPLRSVGHALTRGRGPRQQWLRISDTYRVARRLLAKERLPKLTKRVVEVMRSEGVEGIKKRVRHYHVAHNAARHEPRLFPDLHLASISGAIVRNRTGRYLLASESKGYSYVEPERPLDMPARLKAVGFCFSIVVPVYNTSPRLLEALLRSVKSQWYPYWELILVDDASPAEETQAALGRLDDSRIRVLRLTRNRGISGATNAGLELATGDFIVFMDHDDELTVDCLYQLALCVERESPDFIYSDEDKISESGELIEPHFKPDWSPDTMMSTMYTGHVSCVRRELLKQVGPLRSEVDGCQDWDFVLRLAEVTDRISHIPKVLYHWRISPGSVASDIAAKPYVLAATQRVRQDALTRRGLSGRVEPVPQVKGYFRVAYDLTSEALVSIIIPTRDNARVLRRCVDSIRRRTSYRRFEMIILDNGSVTREATAYLDSLASQENIKLIRHDAPFNFSELNNIGARAAAGDLLLFLNDDTEVLQDDWLERLGGFAQLPHVGPVGAKLVYPDGHLVQHAGVVNLEAGPGHAFAKKHRDEPGYFMRNLLEYNWLAVTGACLMVERRKFEAVNGFAESLPIAYNDVDLCMRLRDAGYYSVVVQAVSLIHHESVSRGLDHVDPIKAARLSRDRARMYERNPKYFQYDPFHNPNLHPDGIHFEVAA
jgi:O-antigen biosynthesis protein